LVEIESPTLSEELNAKWEEVKIPSELYKVISRHHNSHVGHHGVERTLAKLTAAPTTENDFRETPKPWVHMREHVIKFIKTCPCCQKMNRIRTPVHTRGFTTAAEAPMTRISIDTLGPLPADAEGNEYIIVIIDSFTRWVELYPSRDATAAEAVKALISYIKTFGQPSQLLSDNGTQYANQVVAELCTILGTEHIRTVAHSHQENAIVERVNKEILRHLRALVNDDKTYLRWAYNLVFVQRILNTTMHESIGVAPSQLLFGNSVQLTASPLLPISALNIDGKPLTQWADEMLRSQEKYLKKATALQAEKDRKHMLDRLKHLELTIFPPGSWVKAMYPPTRMGWRAPNKLMLDWRGPYQVVSRHKGEYELRDPAMPTTLKISEHLLEAYHIDTSHSTPFEVAITDRNMWEVDEVLDVRGHHLRRTTLQLLIKWTVQEKPEWTPWNSSFLHNFSCHRFFLTRGGRWKTLVPKNYRDQYAAEQAAPALASGVDA
jgi:transposase InsO family protein